MLKKLSDSLLAIRTAVFGAPAPKVAILRFQGVIGPDSTMQSAINMQGYAKLIDEAFEMKGLAAVALQINSPGGSPVQAGMIVDRIRALASEKDIPVLAFTEDVAASGGYMLALAADEIFVHSVSIVGSIGVISAGFGFPKAMEKLGVERRMYTAGDKKALMDPFSAEDEAGIERLKSIQKDAHEFFKAMVRDRRGKRLKGARKQIFSGDVFVGSEAIKLGLVDAEGDIRSVLRGRFSEDVKMKVLEHKKPRLSRLFGFGAGGDSKVMSGENAVASHLARGLLNAVEERSVWNRWGL